MTGPRASDDSITLSVSGMTCGGCAKTVERLLSRFSGVTGDRVELATGSVVMTGEANPDALAAGLSTAGYRAEVAPAAAHRELGT